MINLLANLLSPIFGPMGVSSADLLSYLQMCSGYVYAILAALAVMIVVLAAAVKVKKGAKLLVRGSAVVAFLAVTALIVNLVCFGPHVHQRLRRGEPLRTHCGHLCEGPDPHPHLEQLRPLRL